ncbi:DUF4181 domain-containing protein [Planococcus dechangensis]|uniref:DUF4181 domain-containing protein n=1 Tax=Planococcus dechangensis TaxID=1176255 RepID=A0ABV9MCZ0_9BACL
MSWLKFILFFVIVIATIFVMKFSLRKLLKIEKREKDFLSHEHVNDQHKKIDKRVRWGWLFVGITIIYLVIFQEVPVMLYLLLYIAWMATDAFVRAYFQWKHSEQPKESVLTISEMLIWVIAVTVVIYFDVFNFLA